MSNLEDRAQRPDNVSGPQTGWGVGGPETLGSAPLGDTGDGGRDRGPDRCLLRVDLRGATRPALPGSRLTAAIPLIRDAGRGRNRNRCDQLHVQRLIGPVGDGDTFEMSRVDYDPRALGRDVYSLLNAIVVPRPIAWVSTRSKAGVDNVAPHSYFSVASVQPPIVQFSSGGVKDSLRNVRETGEFVVNVSTRPLVDRINRTATRFAPDVDEFLVAGLTTEPSELVTPPRVAESPIALECCFVDERSFGDSTVVFGEVLHIAVDSSVLRDGEIAPELLEPVARLGGSYWAALGDIFEVRRIPVEQYQFADASQPPDPLTS